MKSIQNWFDKGKLLANSGAGEIPLVVARNQ